MIFFFFLTRVSVSGSESIITSVFISARKSY